MAGREFHALRVAEVERLCADAVAVTFDVPSELAEQYAFRPGQALTVRRPGDDTDQRRTYSICAPVGGRPRIGVREMPGGVVSGWLVRTVQVGDAVEVAPPAGTFTPDLSAGGRHVMIAAGSGITPVLSIVASLLVDPQAEVSVFYGNRRADTVMFAEELADLKDRYPTRLELIHLLSREAREVDLFTGRLDASKLRSLLPQLVDLAAVDHWWLCGPYGLVSDATDVLGQAGVALERIHRELFWVDEAPPAPIRPDQEPDGTSSEVTVILDGRSTTVTVAEGRTVLEGVQPARPDLPFACKGGVCGTCRARVEQGEVAMRRNFALDSAELSSGFVLTCQAVAITAAVTVSFDD